MSMHHVTVSGPIQLKRELQLRAVEVYDESRDHVLAPELEAEHTAVPIAADSRVVTPRAFPRYAPERLLDADSSHERAKARVWAEGVEDG